jgi:hypothetical protein
MGLAIIGDNPYKAFLYHSPNGRIDSFVWKECPVLEKIRLAL